MSKAMSSVAPCRHARPWAWHPRVYCAFAYADISRNARRNESDDVPCLVGTRSRGRRHTLPRHARAWPWHPRVARYDWRAEDSAARAKGPLLCDLRLMNSWMPGPRPGMTALGAGQPASRTGQPWAKPWHDKVLWRDRRVSRPTFLRR